jgi:hypothetical protein
LLLNPYLYGQRLKTSTHTYRLSKLLKNFRPTKTKGRRSGIFTEK